MRMTKALQARIDRAVAQGQRELRAQQRVQAAAHPKPLRPPTPTEVQRLLEAARELSWAPSCDSGHYLVDVLTWILTGKEQGLAVGFWIQTKAKPSPKSKEPPA